MTNRLVLLFAGVLVAFPLFAGAAPEEPDEIPTVRLSHSWTGAEGELFEPVLAAAEEELGISITTTVLRHEDLVTLLPTQWRAERSPADVMAMRPGLAAEGAQQGHLVSVTDRIDPDDFVPGAAEVTVVNGERYNVPYIQKTKPGFWYRRSFAEEHGLVIPETWDEFMTLLENLDQFDGMDAPIASGNGDGWPLTDVVEHFLIAFGGPEMHVGLREGEISWTSDAVREVFAERIVPLLEEGYFGEPTEWTTALERWWAGDYGIYFMGSWITGMVEDPEDLGVFMLPGTEAVVSHVDSWYVSDYAENRDAALELAEWLATEGQRIHVQQGGATATYVEISPDIYPPAEQRIAEATAGLEPLVDLDDAIGGEFQSTFWGELQLLWVRPGQLDEILETIEDDAP